MQKSYRNPQFMNSPTARPLRVLAEYLEPQARFAAADVNRALIFYGSARLQPGQTQGADGVDYYAAARQLSARLARWTLATHAQPEQVYICTGGGPGIMEAANRGAYEVLDRLSIGLNISLPHEQGANPYISSNLGFEFHYFFMRKFWFMNLACGLVVFPGGFGTLDELFEVLTLIQTGKSRPLPVILFGKRFWEGLINFEYLAEQHLISQQDIRSFQIVDSVDSAFEQIVAAL